MLLKRKFDLGAVLAWIKAAFEDWYADGRDGWDPRECVWIAKSVTHYCRQNFQR